MKQKSRGLRRGLLLVLCAGMLMSPVQPYSASAERGAAEDYSPDAAFLYQAGGTTTYAARTQEWAAKGYRDVQKGTSVVIPANQYTSVSKEANVSVAPLEGRTNVLKWESGSGTVDYTFTVPESGFYRLTLTYFPLSKAGASESRRDIIRSLFIDGELPFDEARLITMKRLWKDETFPPRQDQFGNHIRPKQEQLMEWQVWDVSDYLNEYPEPHRFYLTKGEHTLRLEGIQEMVALEKLEFRTPETISEYGAVRAGYEQAAKEQKGRLITVEAEQAWRKSDPTVQMGTSTEALVQPESKGSVVYNIMGGWRYGRRGAWAEWKFNVPEDGYYTITPVYEQEFIRGRNVYRTISVDGHVPYRELLQYPFGYANWNGETLRTGDGSEILFKLARGEHTLRMQVNTTVNRPAIENLDRAAGQLKELGENVRRITGVVNDKTIDKGMNWRLGEYIPDLNDRLDRIDRLLRMTQTYLTQEHGPKVEASYPLKGVLGDLKAFKNDPNLLVNSPQRYGLLQEQLANMSLSLMEQPLHLDRILIATPQAKLPPLKASLWRSMGNSISRFFLTFTSNFAAQGRKDPEAIDVWVQRGRDYANLIQEMVDQDFTPETGIKVNVNVMPNPQILILGNAAGIQPDVALGLGESTPADFAMRNALVNLNQFPDYREVTRRFLPGALIPYHYDGGDWALPEVQNFNMLFYRKDILEELKLPVPETWDDVYKTVQELQQKQMNFYLPPEDYLPFLYQHGGEYYSEDGLYSGLDSPQAFEAFKQLTDFFTVYGLDRQANFYQHFRSGSMPVGVADLNTYLMLLVAAPELTGLWDIAPIPGTRKPGGELERWSGGGLQSAVIFRSSDRQKEAWSFLRWWTSDGVQTQFGLDLETINGLEYRWNTANITAFKNQMWPESDLQKIMEQFRWYKEIPRVPGEYFTDRQFKFAWNKTVVDGANYRDSLDNAVREINKELYRKQQEFGFLDDQGNRLKELDVPMIKKPWDGNTKGGSQP